jgi:hypothetical protein
MEKFLIVSDKGSLVKIGKKTHNHVDDGVDPPSRRVLIRDRNNICKI